MASRRPVGENRCVPAPGSREFYLTEQEAAGYSEKTFLGAFARTTTGRFFYAFFRGRRAVVKTGKRYGL
jgi:hypothetical protein